MAATVKAKIMDVLSRTGGAPLTAEEICKRVYGRVGVRERNTVNVALYRMVEAKQAKKRDATWELV